MAFAPDEIEHKEFVPGVRGYRRSEVRAFLRSVAADMAKLEDENAVLRQHDRRAGSGRRSSDAAPNGELLRVLYELRGDIAELQTRVTELSPSTSGGPDDADQASEATAPHGDPDLGFLLRTMLGELGDLRLGMSRLENSNRATSHALR